MRISASQIVVVAALISVSLALAGCGGGGSGGGSTNELLRVKDAQGFPDGKFFGTNPSPPTLNQCIWIELTTDVDPSTLFDASTSNGLSSAARMLSYFFLGPAANLNAASPLTRVRLPGIAVLNGKTNFNIAAKSYGATATQSVTNATLNIDSNVPLVGKHSTFLVFVADSDGDLETIESFLPHELRTNASRLQNSQIMVNLTSGLKSTGGRKLSPEFTTNFIVGTNDQIPPVVDAVLPAKDETGVDIGSTITINFSEPIDASSLSAAALGSLVPSTNAQDNLQVSYQTVPPGQSTPQLFNMYGTVTPSSGQTSQVTFTPLFNFPGNTLVVVNIYSAASTLIAVPPPYHPAATDPSANLLSPNHLTDGAYTFTTGPGPKLANNPIDPEAIHFITTSSAMGTVRTNWYDFYQTGVDDLIQEVNAEGELAQFFPGGVQDGIVGPFISNLLGTGNNTINNPPRQCQYWLLGFVNRGNPPTTHVVEPGKWTPTGLADISAALQTTFLPGEPPNPPPLPNYCPESITPGYENIKPAQPYGVYLFVTNETENVVHCVSSSSFQVIKDIPTPDPRGVGISPDFNFLYVSNFGANSLSVLDVSAGNDGLPKGDLVRLIPVGSGPWGVAAQPQSEDILVCNRLGKTVSVITVSDLGNPGSPVRVNMQAGDPYEVTAGPRITPLQLPYYAYVTSPTTGEVSIFESGPPQINGFGRDQVIDIKQNLARPTGINGDQWYNTSTFQNPVPSNDSWTGAYVVMNGNGTVAHLKVTRFSIPNFPNPPPALVEARFEITAEFNVGENPVDVCVDNNVIIGSTPDGKVYPYTITNPPVTTVPWRLYVTNGNGTIGVYEIRTGREIRTLKAAGASRIFGYYSQ
jgi:hypothetical protein